MPKAIKLSDADRDFLHLLAEAAATNPFSDEYYRLQLKISGCDASVPAEDRYKIIVARVSEQVQRMDAEGSVNVRRYAGADRQLLRHALGRM